MPQQKEIKKPRNKSKKNNEIKKTKQQKQADKEDNEQIESDFVQVPMFQRWLD